MRITCPTCAAEYDVPGSLAPGRAVKCARCGNKWAPEPAREPDPVFEVPPEPEPEPPPPPEPTVMAPPTPLVPHATVAAPRRLPLILAWAGSAVLLVALVAAAIVWREPIMHVWPPSIRLYSTLQLTAHP